MATQKPTAIKSLDQLGDAMDKKNAETQGNPTPDHEVPSELDKLVLNAVKTAMDESLGVFQKDFEALSKRLEDQEAAIRKFTSTQPAKVDEKKIVEAVEKTAEEVTAEVNKINETLDSKIQSIKKGIMQTPKQIDYKGVAKDAALYCLLPLTIGALTGRFIVGPWLKRRRDAMTTLPPEPAPVIQPDGTTTF